MIGRKKMSEKMFSELMQSIKEADLIEKGELQPARVSVIDALDIAAIRNKTHKTQEEFAAMLNISIAYNLAKRLRYYQAVLDISTLEKGTDYEQLHDAFLIFFCTLDYLAKGLPVYTFKTVCSEDMRIGLPDAITKVIVNSSAAENRASA